MYDYRISDDNCSAGVVFYEALKCLVGVQNNQVYFIKLIKENDGILEKSNNILIC